MVWYVLCVLVWGFLQEALANAGMLIIPVGQSRAYMLGGGALLWLASFLLMHMAVAQDEEGNRQGGYLIVVGGVGLLILFFLSPWLMR